MKSCPLCKYSSLEKTELEEGLDALSCKLCNGNWLTLDDYLSWDMATLSEQKINAEENTDSKEAKQCIECGKIMMKFKVSSVADFHIDRCMTCGGMWFDKNEWILIKEHGFVANLNLIFTEVWQLKIKKQKSSEVIENLFKSKLKDDYPRVKEIKDWINRHPAKKDILNFLMRKGYTND